MSKTIHELLDGDKLSVTVLLSTVNKGVTNKGAPYLSIVLQDKSGTMDAKFWNVSESQLALYKPGMVAEVSGDVLSHINSIHVLDRSTLDLSEFVQASPIPRAQLKEEIMEMVASIRNDVIRKIVEEILAEYETDFFAYPAASKNHHNFVGGLATHVLGMLKLAEDVCALYPMLHRDLLLGGVLLHDIGKLVELSGPVITEYTMEGKLLGHISIMQAKVAQVADRLQLEGEEVILLRHMVLSHHGHYDYGSPVLPMLPEAEMLYFIDNMDARMNSLQKAIDPIEEGEFTPRIFSLENRSFYKSKLK